MAYQGKIKLPAGMERNGEERKLGTRVMLWGVWATATDAGGGAVKFVSDDTDAIYANLDVEMKAANPVRIEDNA